MDFIYKAILTAALNLSINMLSPDRNAKIRVYLHQPRTVCFPHVITYSLFWFFPGITSNLMLVSPIPWFLQ